MAIETKLQNVCITFSLQSASFLKGLLNGRKDELIMSLTGLSDPFEIAECKVNIKLCDNLLKDLKSSITSDLGKKAWKAL